MTTAVQTAAFGDLLRRFRKAAGLTQEELAERAGLSRRGITDLERGARQTPHRDTLTLLIEALELTEEHRAALFAAARRHRVSTSSADAIATPTDAGQPQAQAQAQAQTHVQQTAADGGQSAEVLVPTRPPALDSHAQPQPQPRGDVVRRETDELRRETKEERRLVTILFADVIGSTALGEALDPEDVRALMRRYYQHAHRVIAAHGGTLEKFIGDAVLAIFGLPQAHGNDAERALAAAVALREAIAGDSLLAGQLTLRISVNTGEVVATPDVSGGDFLVTGDAVNVTARLQSHADQSEILVGERTYAAADAVFAFGAARVLEVKGKRQPVRVFPLLGPRPARRISRPPLVGRRQDLAQLALLRDRALEERRPQLVSIVAPAGTGKTRLLEEFLARLDPADGFRVATARCVPYGQTLTYWPLRGLLDDLLGSPSTKERVAAAFTASGYVREDATRLAELVLVTLGVAPEESAERESIFHAWRLLIEVLARQAPRMVVFDDLHWASDSLLDLVEHVLRPRTEAALVVVATSRPELLDRRPAWGGGHDNWTALTLSPLNAHQTGDLVTRLVEGLPEGVPESVRQQIVVRSGGNPFFAIELVQTVTQSGGGAVATSGAQRAPLPDTVHEAVLARLDLLAPLEREALQVAAVAGRTFRLAALQAVLTGREPVEIEAALDGLCTRDLIVAAEGDGAAYTFRHILFRDVAYGMLSRAERVRLHAAVAAWLEDFAAARLDEFTELIAYHYREAVLLARQSLTPLDLPVDPQHAAAFLVRAGEVAGRAGAFAEARTHLESAIALAPEAEHARLYEQLGDCMQLGDTAIQAYRTAYECWQRTSATEPLVGARIVRKLLVMYVRWPATWAIWPDHRELDALLAEARRLAEETENEQELWHVRVAGAYWAHYSKVHAARPSITTQEIDGIRKVFLMAAAHFETCQDWSAFSEALDGYAGLMYMSGAYKDAVKAVRRRLRTPGVPATERGDAVNMLAHVHLWAGHYGRCVATMRQALAQLRPGEPVILLGKGPLWAAGAAGLGDHWSALDWLLPALEEGREQVQHDRGMAYLAAGYFVALHIAQARDDRRAAASAMAMLEQLLTPRWAQGAHALLAAYRLDDHRPLALGAADEVWPYLQFREFRFVGALLVMFLSERDVPVGETLLSFMRVHAESERADFLKQAVAIAEAVAGRDNAALAAAIDEAEAHGLVPHAARMRLVLAQRTGDRAPLERALPVLERLGDRQFLRRLDAVVAMLRGGQDAELGSGGQLGSAPTKRRTRNGKKRRRA